MSYKSMLADYDVCFLIEDEETVLEAALRQNINLPYGCRAGTCGTCKAKIINGQYHYDNEIPPAISPQERAAGQALLCQVRPDSDLVIEARTVDRISGTRIRRMSCRVTLVEKLSADVIRLLLKPPITERLQFLPGQYIDILMRDGMRRPFSIANSPHENQHIELHVRYYDGGLFSEYALNDLQEHALLRIEDPLGSFTLQKSDHAIIMIAGGTGFAPVKSIISHMLYIGDRREIHLYWGARDEPNLYMHDLAQRLANENKHIHYIPVLSKISDASGWKGRTGFVHEAALKDFADLSAYDVYACGPPLMIDAVIKELPKRGLNKDQLFFDSFEFAGN